jgi:hypothetical protein
MIGEYRFADFGLRADELISELSKVPGSTPIAAMCHDGELESLQSVVEVDIEFECDETDDLSNATVTRVTLISGPSQWH